MRKSAWHDTFLRKRLANVFGPVRSRVAHNDSFFLEGRKQRRDLIPTMV